MARIQVETTINRETREYLCDANQSLLDLLRDELMTKFGVIPNESMTASPVNCNSTVSTIITSASM